MFSNNSSRSSYLAQVKSKIWRFCAYRDRSIGETKDKLKNFEIDNDEIFVLIDELINEKFLDDKRFIKSFCRSKINSYWGKIKIKHALINKYKCNISHIDQELSNINQDEYLNNLYNLIEKKKKLMNYTNSFEDNEKLKRFAASKGFEAYLIIDVLNKKD